MNLMSEIDDDFDELAELLGEEDDNKAAGYWLSKPKLEEIQKIHDYLEQQPEAGKILSIATLYKLAIGLNDDEPLSDLQVGAIKDSLSPDVNQ